MCAEVQRADFKFFDLGIDSGLRFQLLPRPGSLFHSCLSVSQSVC